MTGPQVEFLKRLLAAVGEEYEHDRWVEVGAIVGIDMKTVHAFEDRGLIWTENRGIRQVWARLRTGEEIER